MTSLELRIRDILECDNESAIESAEMVDSRCDCLEAQYVIDELVQYEGWDSTNAIRCVAAWYEVNS